MASTVSVLLSLAGQPLRCLKAVMDLQIIHHRVRPRPIISRVLYAHNCLQTGYILYYNMYNVHTIILIIFL